MTLFYYDPVYLQHDTGARGESAHPENANRLPMAMQELEERGHLASVARPTFEKATIELLTQVHDPDYVQHVKSFAANGGGSLDEDTIVCEASFDIACRAAGAACDAVAKLLNDEDRNAFCFSRPPGHHATRNRAMGFCLFNHVAVAAKLALERFGLSRVMIVDFDVHHGNGTQDLFWTSDAVGYYSIHRSPLYPHTGAETETGSGAGLGWTRNVPIRFGTPPKDQVEQFTTTVRQFAEKIRPELLIVSAGFDAHRLDPIGSLGLEASDFREYTQTLLTLANEYSNGRLLSILEGGYHPGVLAECVSDHVEQLLSC